MKIQLLAALFIVFASQLGAQYVVEPTTTKFTNTPENAKGWELRSQVSTMAALVTAKQFVEAQKLSTDIRTRFEASFTPGLKQYAFESREEFNDFRKTATERFEWIDWGYQSCLQMEAFMLTDRGDYASALVLLARVEALAPASAVAATETGYALNRLSRFQEALASYRKAYDLSVKFPSQAYVRAMALRGMGFALGEMRQYDEAEKAYRESLSIEPDNSLAKGELTYLQHQRGAQ